MVGVLGGEGVCECTIRGGDCAVLANNLDASSESCREGKGAAASPAIGHSKNVSVTVIDLKRGVQSGAKAPYITLGVDYRGQTGNFRVDGGDCGRAIGTTVEYRVSAATSIVVVLKV